MFTKAGTRDQIYQKSVKKKENQNVNSVNRLAALLPEEVYQKFLKATKKIK